MFKNLSVKWQILIPACGVTGIILLGLIIGIVLKEMQIAKDKAVELAHNMGQKYAFTIKAELNTGMNAGRTLAHTLQALKQQDRIKHLGRDSTIGILKTILSENKDFLGTYTAWETNAFDGKDSEYKDEKYHDNTGRYVPYLSRDENNNVHIEALVAYDKEGDGDYYLLPKRHKKEQLLEPYEYEVAGKKILLTSLVTPILSNGSDFVGIAGVDFALDHIQKVVSDIKPFETGYAYLISNKGMLVSHPNKSLVGKSVTSRMTKEQGKKTLDMIASGKTHQFFWTHPNGTEFIQVMTPFKIGNTDTPWSFGIAIPIDHVIEASKDTGKLALILAILAIIIISGIIYWIINNILKRISLSVSLAQKISRGNLNHAFNIQGNNELSVLAYALKDMVSSLRKKEALAQKIAEGDLTQKIELASEEDELGKALQKMQENLTGMLGTIQQNSMTLSSSLTELSAISSQISNATTEMSSQSNTVAGASEEISVGVNTLSGRNSEMNSNVQSIAATSTEVSQNMENISNGIGQLTDAIQQVFEKSENAQGIAKKAIEISNFSTEKMNELDQSASKIGEFSQIIKEIAQQTNLLALNANIEAASAGEAGKGFAVVANEIKELANQSSKSAEDISITISEIQSNTANSVSSMKDVSKIIETIDQSTIEILDLTQTGEKSVNEMVNHIKESSVGVKDVSKLINEISTVTESTAQTSEEFSSSISEISKNIQELNTVVSETATGVNQVTSETKSLSNISENLRQVVGKFKLN